MSNLHSSLILIGAAFAKALGDRKSVTIPDAEGPELVKRLDDLRAVENPDGSVTVGFGLLCVRRQDPAVSMDGPEMMPWTPEDSDA